MSVRQSVTLDDVILLLNELTAVDSEAVKNLIDARIVCNEEFSGHPTVQVGVTTDGDYVVGVLGVLNGLFGIDEDGFGMIAAVYKEDQLLRFAKRSEFFIDNK